MQESEALANDDVDFEAGFSNEEVALTERPEPEVVEETPPEVVPPKLAQITEDQYQELLAKATLIDDIRAAQEKQFGTAFGKIGGIERTINQLREASPGSVELTDTDFEGLEFPEIARDVAKVLAGKIKTQGQSFDPAQVEVLARNAVQSERATLHREFLDGMVPGWSEIIGLPDAEGKIPETDYRKWLGTQPEDYRKKINESNNAFEISASVKTFQDFRQQEEAKAKAATSRNKRIEAAITPRSAGGHAPAPSDDDDFNAGFNGG